jgi:site-specific recombinase XerD
MVAANERSPDATENECVDAIQSSTLGILHHKLMSDSEVRQVLAFCENNAMTRTTGWANELVFRLSTICGLRCSEIQNLRSEHVILDQGTPRIYVERGKGHLCAETPIIDKWTIERFKWWKDRCEAIRRPQSESFVFSHLTQKQYNRPNSIKDRFRSACKSLGMKRAKQLTTHCGRHTAATRLVNLGYTLPTVQMFLRHRNLTSTLVYLHAQPMGMFDLYSQEAQPNTERARAIEDVVATQAAKQQHLESSMIDLEFQTPELYQMKLEDWLWLKRHSSELWVEIGKMTRECRRFLYDNQLMGNYLDRPARRRSQAIINKFVLKEIFDKDITLEPMPQSFLDECAAQRARAAKRREMIKAAEKVQDVGETTEDFAAVRCSAGYWPDARVAEMEVGAPNPLYESGLAVV